MEELLRNLEKRPPAPPNALAILEATPTFSPEAVALIKATLDRQRARKVMRTADKLKFHH